VRTDTSASPNFALAVSVITLAVHGFWMLVQAMLKTKLHKLQQTRTDENKNYIYLNPTIFTLMLRPLSRTFNRRSWFNSSSGSCHSSDVMRQEISHVWLSVQLPAALILVHRMLSLLLDVYCFLDPSSTSVRLQVQDCHIIIEWWTCWSMSIPELEEELIKDRGRNVGLHSCNFYTNVFV